jgi:tungstate transport system substrate-binding protein
VIRALALASILVTGCGGAVPSATTSSAPRPDILLATTTSTQDSGLLDALIPDFEKRTGYRVRTSAVGTGAALAIGAKGDADVVLVHAPPAELDFMAQGNGDRRLLVMHNDFIVVGPPADPARIKGKSALDALKTIAGAHAAFISRGDGSGTDILEKSLWKQAGIAPARPWYVESGTGMGQSLTVASEKKAYVVTDRGTFLARRGDLALEILVEKDPPLINLYHVITVNRAKFPRVNREGADAFAGYLVSPPAQEIIRVFGMDKFGQPLFFPDAGKRDEDVR